MKDLDIKKMKEAIELKEKNREMSFSPNSSTSKDSFLRKKNRREIARLLTEMNKKK